MTVREYLLIDNQVIANMTVGKDVSTLFTDVVNCIQTDNLELKKLVYLYLINYAKSQPDLAMLAVNTFVKDANDPVSSRPDCQLSHSLIVTYIEPFDPRSCHSYYGLHPREHHHGVPL